MPDQPEQLFAEIQRDHLGLIGRTAHAFAPEPADREELFQDILIALWQALPQFSARAKLSTYVYRVALNCALNWKRSRRRYRQKLEQFTMLLPDLDTPSNPHDRERLHWLYARIRELPPVDRTLILLSLDRLSYGEIADVTGLSESNVGVRLHRIKQDFTSVRRKLTMNFDQLEALWANQPPPPATLSPTALTRAIRPELNRRSRVLGYLMFTNGLGLLLFPILTVANYRYNPARYGTPWHIAQDVLQLAVIVFWVVFSVRRIREHRALLRRQADTLRAATEVSVGNLEAEMKFYTTWRLPLIWLTLLSLASSLVLVGVNHDSFVVGLQAALVTLALLALVGFVGWRYYRVNLAPAYARQKELLAQLGL